MTKLLVSPTASSGIGRLADWIELKSLFRADNKASLQDLAAELRRGGSTDAVQESPESLFDSRGETTQRLASEAFSEIEERAEAAGAGYPFSVGARHIELAPQVDIKASTYIFQLLLSNFGVEAGKTSRVRPERDFEDISLDAAQSYLGHNAHDGSYLFGYPRRTNAKSFNTAVDELSALLDDWFQGFSGRRR